MRLVIGLSKHRKPQGYALVSIIVIGLFAIMLLLALGGMLVSIAQSEAVSKHKAGLLNAAETGLEYVLYDMKRANVAGEPTYEFTDDSPPVLVNVPSSWLSDSRLSVKARVRKLDTTEASQYSLLWSPQLDPSQPIFNLEPSIVNTYTPRVVEVTASNGSFSSSLRVVAMPNTSEPSSVGFPSVGILAVSKLNVSPDGGPLSISDSVFNPDVLDNPGSLTSNSDGSSSFKLRIQSNQEIDFSGSTESSKLNIYANVAASSNSVLASSNSIVHGQLLTNGSLSSESNFIGPSGENPGGNVRAEADINSSNSNRLGVNNTSPIDTSGGGNPLGVSPIPSINQTSVTTSKGTTTNDLSSYLNTISDGKLNDPGSDAIKITNGGDFYTDSLVVNDSVANLEISSPDNKSPVPTVKVFIQGNNSESAVEIDARRFDNQGNPENFQIFYDGPNQVNINLNGAPFKGLIYAPNASVNIVNGDNGSSSSQFQGAIVGNEVNIKFQGKMKLLDDPSSGSDLQFSPSQGSIGYKVASYQEVNGKLVE